MTRYVVRWEQTLRYEVEVEADSTNAARTAVINDRAGAPRVTFTSDHRGLSVAEAEEQPGPSLFDFALEPTVDTPRPAPVRRTDPGTSAKGAEAVRLRAGTQRARLLAVYPDDGTGLTSHEAGERSGLAAIPGCCYWHRVSDLVAGGWLEPTGEERVSAATGSPQAVHRLTDRGRAEARRLAGGQGA